MSHVLAIRTEKTSSTGRYTMTYRCEERGCDTRGRISGRDEWVRNLFADLRVAHAAAHDDVAEATR